MKKCLLTTSIHQEKYDREVFLKAISFFTLPPLFHKHINTETLTHKNLNTHTRTQTHKHTHTYARTHTHARMYTHSFLRDRPLRMSRRN